MSSNSSRGDGRASRNLRRELSVYEHANVSNTIRAHTFATDNHRRYPAPRKRLSRRHMTLPRLYPVRHRCRVTGRVLRRSRRAYHSTRSMQPSMDAKCTKNAECQHIELVPVIRIRRAIAADLADIGHVGVSVDGASLAHVAIRSSDVSCTAQINRFRASL